MPYKNRELNRISWKKWKLLHPNEYRERYRKYNKKHKNRMNIQMRKWREIKKLTNPEEYKRKQKEYQTKYRQTHKEHFRLKYKKFRNRLRLKTLRAYGGSFLKCACCKERKKEFLTIDHINGGGTKHRKEIGGSGSTFFKWLEKMNYPSGFQVLCMNCNWAKGKYGGICPHKNKNYFGR